MSDSDPVPKTIQPGIYRHNKTGNLYEVLGVALSTETNEQFVVYRALYDQSSKQHAYELFARPYDMFVEQVELGGRMQPRFEYVGEA